jgi:hypothetical protein
MLLRLMIESPVKQEVAKHNGQWVTVDPSTWDDDMDVEIEVGLGVGQAAQRVQSLIQLLEVQAGFVANGLGDIVVTPDNAYNTGEAISKAMGFKVKDKFFTNPATAEPKEPETPPEVIKAQMEAKTRDDDRELRAKELKFETLKFEAEQQMKIQQMEAEQKLEQARIRSAEKMTLRKIDSELERARIQAEAQKETAEVHANAKTEEQEAA